MAPKTKRRNRKSPPQCRVKLGHVKDLERYRSVARRWGYAHFSPFLRDLMDALSAVDPRGGTIPFRPTYADLLQAKAA